MEAADCACVEDGQPVVSASVALNKVANDGRENRVVMEWAYSFGWSAS